MSEQYQDAVDIFESRNGQLQEKSAGFRILYYIAEKQVEEDLPKIPDYRKAEAIAYIIEMKMLDKIPTEYEYLRQKYS